MLGAEFLKTKSKFVVEVPEDLMENCGLSILSIRPGLELVKEDCLYFDGDEVVIEADYFLDGQQNAVVWRGHMVSDSIICITNWN